MKKFITLLMVFLFINSFCLYADNVESFEKDPLAIGGKKPFGMQDRSFEIGILNFNVNLANNFLTIQEIFKDVVAIDIDNLSDGFKLNLGLDITPFYISFKSKKGWGFGLSTNIEGIGILGLSGNLLTLSEAVNDNSDISGALFASATINAFFSVKKLKISINPSLFYTLAYVTPPPESTSGLVYTLDYSAGNTKMCIDYNVRIYTGFSTDDDNFSLTSIPGFDLNIGLEYPLAKEIGLSKILPFLDFDISINAIHVPIIKSKISNYTEVSGRIGDSENPITLFNGEDGSDFLSSFETPDSSDPVTGVAEIEVSRPFKIIARLDWRPIWGTKLLTISPVFGFSYNELYSDPVSWEWGVNACLNVANFFLFKAGVNYMDRMYVNSVGIGINLRAFELDVGVDIRAQTFEDSWTGKGLGVNFGLKFGW